MWIYISLAHTYFKKYTRIYLYIGRQRRSTVATSDERRNSCIEGARWTVYAQPCVCVCVCFAMDLWYVSVVLLVIARHRCSRYRQPSSSSTKSDTITILVHIYGVGDIHFSGCYRCFLARVSLTFASLCSSHWFRSYSTGWIYIIIIIILCLIYNVDCVDAIYIYTNIYIYKFGNLWIVFLWMDG